MYLRGVANRAVQTVRRDELVSIQRSTGYTIGEGLKQIPSYTTTPDVPVNLQALTNDDLKQIAGLNIQGTLLAMYVDNAVYAVQRPTQKGGDIITRADGSKWLIVQILENWDVWTKA